jgi:hypothetical protein
MSSGSVLKTESKAEAQLLWNSEVVQGTVAVFPEKMERGKRARKRSLADEKGKGKTF